MKKLPFGTNRRTVLDRWGRLKVVLHERAPKAKPTGQDSIAIEIEQDKRDRCGRTCNC